MENQGSTGNRFCAKCGAPLVANAVFCAACGQHVEAIPAQTGATPPQAQPAQNFSGQPANVAGAGQAGLKCPRCGSTNIQATKRGWKWTTGFIGSGKMVATCMQCGNKF